MIDFEDEWFNVTDNTYDSTTATRLAEKERKFVEVYVAACLVFRVGKWHRALTPEQYLHAVSVDVGGETELQRMRWLSDDECREWLDGAADRELARNKDWETFVQDRVTCLSASDPSHANLHTYMLRWAVDMLLTRIAFEKPASKTIARNMAARALAA